MILPLPLCAFFNSFRLSGRHGFVIIKSLDPSHPAWLKIELLPGLHPSAITLNPSFRARTMIAVVIASSLSLILMPWTNGVAILIGQRAVALSSSAMNIWCQNHQWNADAKRFDRVQRFNDVSHLLGDALGNLDLQICRISPVSLRILDTDR